MIKFFKYFIQAVFIYLFFLIGKILGLNLSRKIFSFIFNKIGPLIKSNSNIRENLSNFSKNISDTEVELIKSKMWSNYGKTFIEYIFLNKFKKNNSHIKIKGEEKLNEIRQNEKPVIFVSGHFANFELMSMEIFKKKLKLATIYRPLNNYFLNFFMEYLRKKFICKNQIKKGVSGVREAIEYIQNNYSIALMIDQRVTEGEKIKFFNKISFTTTLPAQLALKYDLPIFPIFIERKENDSFEMEIYKPINSSEYKDKFEVSKKLNEILEDMIKRNPSQWIWTHKRWKL